MVAISCQVDMGKTLDIVIVNHNSAKDTVGLLNGLGDVPTTWSAIIVDNGSCLADRRLLKSDVEQREWATVIFQANRGYSAGVNRGVKESSADVIAVLNPDVRVDVEVLTSLAQLVIKDRSLGVVAPTLNGLSGERQTSCRRVPSIPALMGNRGFDRLHPIFRVHRERYLMIDVDDHVGQKEIVDVPYCLGAFWVFRRDAFSAVGFMDERYFLYFEDIDLCLRMWTNGLRVGYVRNINARHEHRRLSLRWYRRAFWSHLRSAIVFYLTYPQFAFHSPYDVGEVCASLVAGR